MLIDFLTSKYHHLVQSAHRCYAHGDLEKAEQIFSQLLRHHADPHMTSADLADAHAGLGAVALVHKDFFEATRWYTEAKHLLDTSYKHDWPQALCWKHAPDRPAIRTLFGLAHLSYHKRRTTAAKKLYQQVIASDPADQLSAKRYFDAIMEKKSFDDVAR